MDNRTKVAVIGITTFVIALAVSHAAYAADEMVEQCKKITIAGSTQWPPYTIVEEDTGNISGAGIELAEQILQELDVPVEKVLFDDKLKMLHALNSGGIDLVVSTYSYAELEEVADILKPAFTSDPITVLLARKKIIELENWESLAGQHGIMSYDFVVDDETNSYFTHYLQIDNNGSLLNMLQKVKNKKYDYAVGSYQQLLYAIKANNLQTELSVSKQLSKGGGVHMAFSKTSVCHHYAAYVRKRLQDYKNNGKVEKILTQYKQK